MDPKGFFLVLEGIDKCGKSTQVRLLHEFLTRKGIGVFLTREPGGTFLGEGIRHLLLDPAYSVTARAELLLYEASRAQHVVEKVLPALGAGKMVLSDRFSLATLAYQGIGRQISLKTIHALNQFASFNVSPDLTLVLDLPVKESLKRMGNHRDRMEKQVLFLKKVQKAYQVLAKNKKNVTLIKADVSVDHLHEKIIATLEGFHGYQKFMNSRKKRRP